MMEQLFWTPLFTYETDGQLNKALLSEIAEIQQANPESTRSYSGEWRSSHDFLQRGGACGRLNLRMQQVFKEAMQEMIKAGYNRFGDPLRVDGWINVNPPGSFIAPHCHPNAKFCGTYYVQAGPDCGALELQVGENTTPFPLRHKIEPKPGMFVLFPAYLYHWVYPNNSDRSRISISWNMAW